MPKKSKLYVFLSFLFEYVAKIGMPVYKCSININLIWKGLDLVQKLD